MTTPSTLTHACVSSPESHAEPFQTLDDAMLRGLAAKYGTPLFVFDLRRFESSCRSLASTWRHWFPGGRVYYSYKTNHLPEICMAAHSCGMGADVVSGYELQHARRYGKGCDIVFNGPMKTEGDLRAAIEAKALVNVDAREDIIHLARAFGQRTERLRVGLRVNPGLPVYRGDDPSFDFEHTRQVRRSKFGWPIADGSAEAVALELRQKGLDLEVLHCQLGSQIDDIDRFILALTEVVRFAKRLRQDGFPVRRLNVGGGFAVSGMVRSHRGWMSELYTLIDHRGPGSTSSTAHGLYTVAHFASRLKAELVGADLLDVAIDCEPGRVLVSDAMVFVSAIQAVKHFADSRWLVLDGGLNLLPTAAFGESRRVRFIPTAPLDGAPVTAKSSYSLGGPLCYEGDVIQRGVPVPAGLAAGSYVCLSDVGAYSVSRSTSFNQPRAAVVMLSGSDERLVWRRETYSDIFAFSGQQETAT